MTDATPLNENEIAFTALSLFRNRAHGVKPDWFEIEAWQQKTLSDARAEEVLSHIANDAECFQQWLDICEASDWLEQNAQQVETKNSPETAVSPTSPGESPKGWLASLFGQPLPVYAAGFAALFLAVLVAPLLRNEDNLQQRLNQSYERYMAAPPGAGIASPLPRQTRTLGNLFDQLTDAGIEQNYFSQGIRQGLAKLQATPDSSWIRWLETQPADGPDCAKANDENKCLSVAEDYNTIGQWALVVYYACQGDLMDSASSQKFWQQQYELYLDLQKLPAMENSQVLKPVMADHQGQDKESVCLAVDQLLNTLQ